ncbi:serine hydrolase domain-containing protein [Stenotrophomonas pavanii]|uniref:serine hydrolase domain-containing protein n=2 Tax=Pseudomonadota TaxID=1224 RepID=UPI001134683A|nr:serine hydrolase domain-containing protein [Stenotrophomonas pavanii]TGR45190.1 class A beta-lactamase-related serine hydrolase [bacterium M00.F.Ca.ET.199.01.1.1]TGT03968.1 class A beta-lactamase-related serine hydrolase [bacterium M00.F.Ca.ET.177.01.1.1]TGT58486.1 class A beta-lactamase-related serine hydrolase [Mesorhizobium sp. M00.F.Ca.ET.170.01.1.1]TGU08414.1 class A beta-lactamase-related serine hydrolase [bacterium M00.F.Ca.ET.163.01.1.1]TGU92469.1 class A beta-lactamase-related seri
MYRTFVAALLCALFVVPIASARGLTPDLSTQLDAQLQANRERYGIAGQAVLVAHNDQVLYQGASGERDPATHALATVDSIFAAQSMAKLLTSTLVMQLVDEGKVDLDAPAGRYVPDLPAAWRAIRVRDFLNHSSGIAEYYERVDNRWVSRGYTGVAPDLAAALKVAAAAPLQFATGSRVQYTQANYLVLTALLEAHYRRPYPAIARERILQPLKMTSTSWGVASVPAQRAAVPYIGKDGALQPANEDPWPNYGWGHADLQTSVGDMNRFLQALATGRLLRTATLEKLWQPQKLSGGGSNFFSTGWDTTRSDGYTQVGHDGGTRVRARLAYKDTLASGYWVFVYLTNGSARNVWSSTLVESTMAVAAPKTFPHAVLSERLIAYALDDDAAATQAMRAWLRDDSRVTGDGLERAINAGGYAIRESLGAGRALKVFTLNTELYPDSANAWDSLAECHAALGEKETAERLYAKSKTLAKPSR